MGVSAFGSKSRCNLLDDGSIQCRFGDLRTVDTKQAILFSSAPLIAFLLLPCPVPWTRREASTEEATCTSCALMLPTQGTLHVSCCKSKAIIDAQKRFTGGSLAFLFAFSPVEKFHSWHVDHIQIVQALEDDHQTQSWGMDSIEQRLAGYLLPLMRIVLQDTKHVSVGLPSTSPRRLLLLPARWSRQDTTTRRSSRLQACSF